MRFLYKRGPGAKRRVMHLTLHDRVTGQPAMRPLCGRSQLWFDTTTNVPLGRPLCRRCIAASGEGGDRG